MNLLICNDDGIKSQGILTLAATLAKKYNITVIAPSNNRSATGHAITIDRPLKLKKTKHLTGIETYSLSGTPADCVKFAVNNFNRKFDAVVSGINQGSNLGTDILYSGTVSAALEGVFFDIPSIAVSLTSHRNKDFSVAADFVLKNLECLVKSCSGEFVWNINVPALPKNRIQGVKYTKMGYQVYSDNYKKMRRNSYLLTGEAIMHDKNDADCDVEWNFKNYITVTPISFNKTEYTVLANMKDKCLEF